jgi:hypothetical protein
MIQLKSANPTIILSNTHLALRLSHWFSSQVIYRNDACLANKTKPDGLTCVSHGVPIIFCLVPLVGRSVFQN